VLGLVLVEWRHLRWLGIAVDLTGCVFSGPTRATLGDEAVAQLQMPGSTELASGGTDEEQTPEGRVPAIAWRSYGVDASWEELIAYFDRELEAQGWEDGGGSSGLTSTTEHAVRAWHRDDRILRLGHLSDSPKPEAGSFLTFYSVALIGQGIPTN
jgi:hypothetical protein